MSLPTASKVGVIAEHVLGLLASHRAAHSSIRNIPPLFIALQGPQGIGKTTLTTALQSALTRAESASAGAAPSNGDDDGTHSSKLAVLSLDDFYLPHDALVELATTPTPTLSPLPSPAAPNKLYNGRGLPGTHDLPLLKTALADLSRLNDPLPPESSIGVSSLRKYGTVYVPRYDKSAHGGQGDRDAEAGPITGPIDVVLLEGWCMGFFPRTSSQLQATWNRVSPENSFIPSTGEAPPEENLEREVMRRLSISFADVAQVNEHLRQYTEQVYPFFTGGFVQLAPPPSHPYSLIYRWRLEQEHNMKARNGGKGMSDEQVKAFIDRYIPGYIFFGDGVLRGSGSTVEGEDVSQNGSTPWAGKGLRVILDQQREVIEIGRF